MQIRTGLRTEIIVNIVLLMGAALLFAGFLLIKLTEQELLAQRVSTFTGTMEVLSLSLPLAAVEGENSVVAAIPASASSLISGLPPAFDLQGWGAVDRDLNALPTQGQVVEFTMEHQMLRQAMLTGEPAVRIHYPSSIPFFGSSPESHAVVTVPVFRRGDFQGAIQARFSLAEVRQRIVSAQKLMLLYAVLYGAVLVLFGVYFLNRSVVRPIRRLQSMSHLIAAGDLEQAVRVEGPREIAELAGSLNAMTAALRQSNLERESHIQALEQTQAELIRSEKMASVGHLAAGMAHEIGNPLGAVLGYLEYLKGDSPPERQKEIIIRALTEAGRIDRLVRELLDYAAPAGSEPQTFDPVTAMVEARDILAHQGAFDTLDIEVRLPPILPATRMVRHQLVQVFINLLLNARDASPPGGTIRLCGGDEGNSVRLSVTDGGAGMRQEVLAHIFDPFFTTKAPGKGRGLGLAICQRVIGEAGGRIEVRSVPGEGSEFVVWLKKAEDADDET